MVSGMKVVAASGLAEQLWSGSKTIIARIFRQVGELKCREGGGTYMGDMRKAMPAFYAGKVFFVSRIYKREGISCFI